MNKPSLFELNAVARAVSVPDAPLATPGKKLVRKGPSPLALEQRFMFDGAGIDTAADVSKPVADAFVHFVAADAALPAAVITARAEAEKLVSEFLAKPDARDQLFALFNGGQSTPSGQWQAAADQLLAGLKTGGDSVRVELRSGVELQGASGAFAAQGPDGTAVIYLNADWVATQTDSAAITTVLVEEIGHSLDAALNPGGDTAGDEGAIFSLLASNPAANYSDILNQAIDSDHGQISIDGVDTEVEFAWTLPTGLDSGWTRLGRAGDIHKPDDGWNTAASAPDLVGTTSSPYLEYKYGQVGGVDVVYFKVRSEEIGTASTYTTPGIQTFLDLNRDGVPEFTMGFTIGSQSNTFNATTGAMGAITTGREVWFQALAGQYTATNPSATSVSGLNDNGAYKVMSDAAGGGAKAAPTGFSLQVFRDLTASATGTDLDGDGNVRENYYIISVPLAEYATFVAQVTAANTLSAGKWIAPVATWTNTTAFQGGSLSTTSGLASYTGDLGSGSYNMGTTTPWRTIWGMNDAPVAKNNSYSTLEDVAITGKNIITNVDPVAGLDSDTETANASLTLTQVGSTAWASLTDSSDSTYTSALGWKQVTLSNGTVYLKIDGSMVYKPAANNSTGDTFTYKVVDADSDPTNVQVSNAATVTLTVTAVNDAPVANADTAIAIEYGDAAAVNSVSTGGAAGVNPAGNVITGVMTTGTGTGAADTDADSGDTRTVSLVTNAAKGSNVTVTSSNTSSTSSPASVAGLYGTVKIGKDGSYVYEVDNSNAAVQALRLTDNTLAETYTYTIIDAGGLTATSTLIITIKGSNDNPIAINDSNTAKESLLAPASAYIGTGGDIGYKATGNVLNNDSDVDRNSETKELIDTSITVRSTTVSYGSPVITITDIGSLTNAITNDLIYMAADVDGDMTTTGDLTWIQVKKADGTAVTATVVGSSPPKTLTLSDTATFAEFASQYATIDKLRTGTAVSNVAVFSVQTAGSTKDGYVSATSATSTLSGLTISNTDAKITAGMTATWNGGTATVQSATYSGNTLTGLVFTGGLVPGSTDLTFSFKVNSTIQGKYGQLTYTLDASGKYLGGYTYTPYTNTETPPGGIAGGLTQGQSYDEVFTYTMKDAMGAIDTAILTITVYGSGSNDPVGVADSATAVEKGGTDTNPATTGGSTSGTDPTANVLSNDTDPNIASPSLITPGTNGFVTTVVSNQTGNSATAAANSTSTSSPASITGKYGTLKIGANGSYVYEANNLNESVQALRTSSNTLQESFTYTLTDAASNGNLSSATLTVTIQGANDAPVGVNDTGVALEAGVNAGSDATGNVLPNDTDVDAGDTKKVTLIHNDNAASPSNTSVTTSDISLSGVYASSVGRYGELRILSDGSYQYIVDNNNATVKALGPTSTPITDTFTYTVTDTDGLTSTATLTISIDGANDAPVAVDNTYTATEDTLLTGKNIITDDDNGGTAGGIDYEDEAQTLSIASINGVAFSSLTGGTDSTHLAANSWKQVTLANGTLYIKADGTMDYQPNANSNAADSFKYTLSDGSASSNEATVNLTVTAVNDTPTVSVSPRNGIVYESGMSTGSDASTPSESFNDYINIGDVDGLSDIKSISFETTAGTVIKTLTVGTGTNTSTQEFVASLAAMVGKSFITTNGTVTLNSYVNGTFGYSFELTSATTDVSNASVTETNAFQVRVIDNAAANATATATVEVVDDVSTANPDLNTATVSTELTGNVRTDAGGVDIFGADGAKVTSPVGGVVGVRFVGATPDTTTEVVGGLGATGVLGDYGTLKLYADGTYTYLSTRTDLTTSVTDTFVYTIEDKDGDRSTTTLTITVNNSAADLNIVKEIVSTDGNTIIYKLTVDNQGGSDATGVKVTDDLAAAGLTFAGTSLDGSTWDATAAGSNGYVTATKLWTIGGLTVSDTAKVLYIKATVTNATSGAVTSIGNTASVDGDQTDNDSADNSDTADQAVADLNIVKEIVSTDGNTIIYKLTVDNQGGSDATGVKVTDDLAAAGLTFAGTSLDGSTWDATAAGSNGYVTATKLWTIGGLTVSDTAKVLYIKATVTNATSGAVTSIGNTASVDGDQTDNDSADNSDTADQAVADLNIVKEIVSTDGNTIIYKLTVDNQGGSDATGVKVTDDLAAAGLTFAGTSLDGSTWDATAAGSNGYVTATKLWTIGGLTVSDTAKVLYIKATVTNATSGAVTSIGNTASVDGDQTDNDSADNSDTADQAVADLNIVKEIVSTDGNTIIYKLTVDNQGGSDATGVKVTDDLAAAGLTFAGTSLDGSTWDATAAGSNGYVTATKLWTIGGLTVSDTAKVLYIKATVTNATSGAVTSIGNTASVDGDQTDNDSADNSDTADQAVADLNIVKEIVSTDGNTIIYKLTVDNQGGSDATGVKVTDDLAAAGLTFAGTSLDGSTWDATAAGSNGYVTATKLWTIGGLTVSDTAKVLYIKATVTNATSGAVTSIGNTASVDGDQTDNDSADNSDTADQAVADLNIVKEIVSTDGNTIIYKLTVDNQGGSDATGVKVTDDLAAAGLTFAGTSLDGSTWDATAAGSNGYVTATKLWTIGGLTVSDTAKVLYIKATVDTGAVSSIINTATVDGSELDNDTFDNSDAATQAVSDLSLIKTVNNASPNVGENVTFTLTVTNTGPDPATNVTVSDSLPAGLTYVSDSGTGAYSGGVWTVGTLANGDTATLTIVASADSASNVVNSATVHGDQTDLNNANNTGSASVDGQAADLRLSKTVNNASPKVGDNVTFTLTVTNSGPDDATNVTVSDSLPAGLTYVSDSGTGAYSGGVWTVGTLANGDTATLTIVARADSASNVVNSANVRADQTDLNNANNTGSASVNGQAADLVTAKTLSSSDATPLVGSTVTFLITVTNNGADAATNVKLTDQLPSGLTYTANTASVGSYNSSTGLWTIGTLANGASATLRLSGTVNAVAEGTSITNTTTKATSDQNDPTDGGNDLTETVVVDKPPVANDDSAAFTPGVATTVNVVANDTTGDTVVATTVVFTSGSATDSGKTLVVAGQGTWSINTTTGAITFTPLAGFTANPTAVEYKVADAQGNFDTATVTLARGAADLVTAKTLSSSDATPLVGSTVTFLITVTNNGADAATNVKLTDQLPSGLTYTANTASVGSYNSSTGLWTIGTLANGASATLRLSGTVNAVAEGTSITNTTTKATSDQNDPTDGGNDLTETVVVDKPPVANDDSAAFTPGVATTVNVVANDTTGDTVVATTVVFTSGSATDSGKTLVVAGQGTWSINTTTGAITFTPLAGFTANPTAVEYKVADAQGNFDTATVTLARGAADLVTAKTLSSSDATPLVGSTVTFLITVTNNGADAATNVKLTDQLPSGLTYTANTASVGSYNSSTGLWTIGTLANGASATLRLSGTVNAVAEGTSITNTTTKATSDQNDPTDGGNDLTETVVVDKPPVANDDSAAFTPGVATTVNVVANDTTGDTVVATTVVFTSGSATDSGKTLVVAGQGTWSINTTTGAITFTPLAGFTANPTAVEYKVADAQGNFDTATVTLARGAADLMLSKTVNNASPNVGENVTFTLTVTNTGPDAATNVTVNDSLPAGLTYVSDSGSGAYSGGVWTVGTLANGAMATLTIVARADSASNVVNSATVRADQTDLNNANNTGSASVDGLAGLKVTDTVVNEASPFALFTVTGEPGQLVTLALADVSAVSADYGSSLETSSDGGVTWAPYIGGTVALNGTGGTLMVRTPVKQDTIFEGGETFTLTATNTGGKSAQGTGTIKDDGTGTIFNPNGTENTGATKDNDRPTLRVIGKDDVSEGSNAIFTVALSNASASATEITLTLGAAGDTAVAADYSSNLTAYFYVGEVKTALPVTGGKVSLPAGVTSFFVSVATTADSPKVLEGAENFTLAATITAGASASDTATILDNGSGKIYDDKGVATNGTPDDDRVSAPTILPVQAPVAPPAPLPAPALALTVAPTPPAVVTFNSALVTTTSTVSLAVLDRASVPIADIRTSSAGFRVVVAEAPAPSLTVFRGITDQFIEPNKPTNFALPADAFVHSKEDATVTVTAKYADGRDLPEWIQFDARSGTFQMSPPPGFNEELQIKVIARDTEGREASAIFKLTVGEGKPKIQGRNGLSEQIKLAAQRSSPWAEMVRTPDGKVQVEKPQLGRAPAAVRQPAHVG